MDEKYPQHAERFETWLAGRAMVTDQRKAMVLLLVAVACAWCAFVLMPNHEALRNDLQWAYDRGRGDRE